MRRWFLFFIFINLITIKSYADIQCTGKIPCDLLDDIAKKSDTSLNVILNELDNKIIIPIIEHQDLTTISDFSRVSYSLNGTNSSYSLGLNLGLVWSKHIIYSSILNQNFNYKYFSGTTRPIIFFEIPNNQYLNTILNVSYWNGPTDYYTNILSKPSNQTDFSFSISERFFFIRKEYIDISIISGISYGNKRISLTQDGVNLFFTSELGTIGWSGVESFNQNINFISLPNYLISTVKIFNISLSTILQYSYIHTYGSYELTKIGTIGPFLGNTGFFNAGILSEKYIKKNYLLPEVGMMLQYDYCDTFINISFNNQLNESSINKLLIGAGTFF